MKWRAIPTAAVLSFLALAACQAEPSVDVCEEAARHQEMCTGEYVTPPLCDEGAAAQAEEVLAASCQELKTMSEARGKGDGALCDWFGMACTPDESIFEGPECVSDDDCSRDAHCAEGSCFAGVGSDEFSSVLDEHTESEEIGGGELSLLVDNGETRELRDELITGAEHSIHFTSLSVSNAGVSQDMAEQFADAVERGVDVRVVVDAVAQDRFAGYDILQKMADAGVEVLAFNPIRSWFGVRRGVQGFTINNRLHEKMIVVDGKDAIVGGRNTGFSFLTPGRAYDVDVHLRGQSVADVQRIFLELWDKNGAWEKQAGCENASEFGFYCPEDDETLADESEFYPPLPAEGDARVRAMYSEPYTQDPSDGYFTYLSAVRGARESITIAAGYFIPPRRLRNHLREAAERGVEVRVLKNSKESTYYEYMYYASLNFYRELLGAGVDIREYQGRDMMHAKAMVVDGELAIVGSFNLSPRSAESNSEALVTIRSDPAVARLERALGDALAEAEPASADIPFEERLKARAHRAVEWLF